MARPSNEFLLAWSSLRCLENAQGWQVIALPSAGPLHLRAGRRSPDNSEAVLVGFPTARISEADKLPEGQGFSVERTDPEGNGRVWLAITRKSAGSIELFSVMACDVVGALDDAVASAATEERLLRILVSRITAWQEFMRRGAQPIGAEAEIGLVGELIFLHSLVEAGVPTLAAINSWVGPLDQIQDFHIGTGAIEVKSTLATTGFVARIGALEQLDSSTRQPLYVAGVRLAQKATGASLPQIAEKLRSKFIGDAEAEQLFSERLLAAGYISSHANRYQRRFEMADIRLLEVTDNFPRLTRGNVPHGILKAMYDVDLDKTPNQNLTIQIVLNKMGTVST